MSSGEVAKQIKEPQMLLSFIFRYEVMAKLQKKIFKRN